MDKTHLIKLSVGTESLETLAAWQSSAAAKGPDGLPRHVTRMWPKREDALLNGGSIYWVIQGFIQTQDFLAALGAQPADFPAHKECCGSYETLVNPDQGALRASTVLKSATEAGIDAMALSCPMCDYNLERKQAQLRQVDSSLGDIPVFYFSQLLAAALGLKQDSLRLELNAQNARTLLENQKILHASA